MPNIYALFIELVLELPWPLKFQWVQFKIETDISRTTENIFPG